MRRQTLMTSSDVARALHLHVNTVRRWSDQGILKAYRIGPRGDRRFSKDAISRFLVEGQVISGPSGGDSAIRL